MKLGIVIYSNIPESVWNAFRLGNYAIKEGDEVKAFLSVKGVESVMFRQARIGNAGPRLHFGGEITKVVP